MVAGILTPPAWVVGVAQHTTTPIVPTGCAKHAKKAKKKAKSPGKHHKGNSHGKK